MGGGLGVGAGSRAVAMDVGAERSMNEDTWRNLAWSMHADSCGPCLRTDGFRILGEGRWIGRHAPEGMDGEAMISDTREGAGARADESTLVLLYNWCWYATRARDGTTADT